MRNLICIIMSTYNGEKYLTEQLNSIMNQEDVNFIIFVRDDGSTDATVQLLDKYVSTGKLIYTVGNNIGAARSFLEAVKLAPEAEYYAFADQDDLWDKNKLSEAIKSISKEGSLDEPILYHSRVKVVDENGDTTGIKGNYIARGYLKGEKGAVIGCTMVFNNCLMKYIKRYNPSTIVMHDAWVHDVCLAIGGKVIYDTNSYIGYRQHANNVVGGKKGVFQSVLRRVKYYKRRSKGQNKKLLLEMLNGYRESMPQENILRAEQLCRYDESLKDTLRVLSDPYYFRGRLWWRIEQNILVILRIF